jgi:hypothetical protein
MDDMKKFFYERHASITAKHFAARAEKEHAAASAAGLAGAAADGQNPDMVRAQSRMGLLGLAGIYGPPMATQPSAMMAGWTSYPGARPRL